MHCERCHHEAAKVFLTQMVGGKLQKVDLCEKCARELGVTSNEPFSLSDLLLKSASLESSGQPEPPEPSLACPSCGCTLAEVRKSGRFGCPACYEVFLDFITEALENVQKGPRHQGKIPAAVAAAGVSSAEQRRALELELARAIRAENYEAAAALRDRIRKL